MVGLMRRARPGADASEPDAAAAVQTLAVLLQAGAVPLVAWRHLADSGDVHAAAVVSRVDEGMPLPAAIDAEGGAWCDIAAAWEIATTVGAPLAEVLRMIAETLRDAASAADDVRIALAEPAGTARLLLWMPFAGLLLGGALGFDTLGVVTRTPLGAACVIGGLLLVLAARQWTRRLLRRARPAPGTPGMTAELVAVALSGGASIERALRLVGESADRGEPASAGSVRRHGVASGDDLTPAAAGQGRIRAVLDLSLAAGVPAGELLRAFAAQERHAARVQGRLRAARLSTQLLVPLGVCTLPAFLLLGVAPMLLSVLGSTDLPL